MVEKRANILVHAGLDWDSKAVKINTRSIFERELFMRVGLCQSRLRLLVGFLLHCY